MQSFFFTCLLSRQKAVFARRSIVHAVLPVFEMIYSGQKVTESIRT